MPFQLPWTRGGISLVCVIEKIFGTGLGGVFFLLPLSWPFELCWVTGRLWHRFVFFARCLQWVRQNWTALPEASEMMILLLLFVSFLFPSYMSQRSPTSLWWLVIPVWKSQLRENNLFWGLRGWPCALKRSLGCIRDRTEWTPKGIVHTMPRPQS